MARSSQWGAAWLLKSASTASISFCSRISSSRISLFKRTMAMGSMNRVEPVADWS